MVVDCQPRLDDKTILALTGYMFDKSCEITVKNCHHIHLQAITKQENSWLSCVKHLIPIRGLDVEIYIHALQCNDTIS